MANEGGQEIVEQNTNDASNNDGGAKDTGNGQVNGQKEVKTNASGQQPDKNAVDYEKRFKGVTSDLQKERKARQQYEADLKAVRADLERERARVAAALGVTPKSKEDQDTEEIRERFKKVFPELGELTKEDIDALREMRQSRNETRATQEHYWSQQARGMVNQVQAAIEKELGGTLTERQKQRIERAYALEGEGNEEFLTRHMQNDPTLIKEFADQWIEDWIAPARRKVTQQEVQRHRPVPSGKDRGIITHGEKKIDVNDPKAVEDVLVRGFKERGGEFGRR